MKSVVFGFALSVTSASQFPVNLWLTLPQLWLSPSVQDLHHLTSPLRQPVTYFLSGTLTISMYTLRPWCYPWRRCLTQDPCDRCIPSHTTYGKVTISGLPPWALHPQTYHLQSLVSSPFSRTVNCLLPSSVLSLFVSGIFLCFLGKRKPCWVYIIFFLVVIRTHIKDYLSLGLCSLLFSENFMFVYNMIWLSRPHSPQLCKQGGYIKDPVKSVLSSASMCSDIGERAGSWAVYQRPWRT